jgi:hypothetical protein
MLDMIDLSGRIQKLKELKLKENGRNLHLVASPSWPADVEFQIVEGMKDADREVMRTMELLGMVPGLVKGNVIQKEGDNLVSVYLNRAVEVLIYRNDTLVDESAIIDIDELLNLDNDVLLQSIEEQEKDNVNFTLTDFAAATADPEQTHIHTNQDNDDTDSDDEDSPQHCNMYAEVRCKYLLSTFRQPKNTYWIGCEFPDCGAWYHESCLGVMFRTNKERETYSLICKGHSTSNKLFEDKVSLSGANASHALSREEEETASLKPELVPKRLKRKNKGAQTFREI